MGGSVTVLGQNQNRSEALCRRRGWGFGCAEDWVHRIRGSDLGRERWEKRGDAKRNPPRSNREAAQHRRCGAARLSNHVKTQDKTRPSSVFSARLLYSVDYSIFFLFFLEKKHLHRRGFYQ